MRKHHISHMTFILARLIVCDQGRGPHVEVSFEINLKVRLEKNQNKTCLPALRIISPQSHCQDRP